MGGLLLWASEAQSHWGSSDVLAGTHLRILPVKSGQVLLPPRLEGNPLGGKLAPTPSPGLPQVHLLRQGELLLWHKLKKALT